MQEITLNSLVEYAVNRWLLLVLVDAITLPSFDFRGVEPGSISFRLLVAWWECTKGLPPGIWDPCTSIELLSQSDP